MPHYKIIYESPTLEFNLYIFNEETTMEKSYVLISLLLPLPFLNICVKKVIFFNLILIIT